MLYTLVQNGIPTFHLNSIEANIASCFQKHASEFLILFSDRKSERELRMLLSLLIQEPIEPRPSIYTFTP